MAKQVLDEFVTLLGYELDEKNLKKFIGGVKTVAVEVTKMVAATVTAVGGIAAGTALLNKETAKISAMSQSVGLAVETVEGLTPFVEKLGFDFEHVVDLAEELNNKIGESKGLEQITPVKESLKILGLEFKKIKDLKPEEQFQKISDAILEAKDTQTAVSAADILFGAEANRIFQTLRNTGKKSLADIIAEGNKLNLQTEESRKGAVRYTDAWAGFLRVIDSGKKLFAGVLGNTLSEYLEKMTEWVALNKDIVRSRIESAVQKIVTVFESMVSILKSTGKALSVVADFFGTSRTNVLLFVAALVLITKNPIISFLIGLGLVIEDVMFYMEGADSVTGSLISKFKEFSTIDKIKVSIVGFVGSIVALVAAGVKLRWILLAIRVAMLFALGPIGWIIAAVSAVVWAFKNWNKIVPVIKNITGFILSVWLSVWGKIAGAVIDFNVWMWGKIKELGGNIITTIKMLAMDVVITMAGMAGEIVGFFVNTIPDAVNKMAEMVINKIVAMVQSVVKKITGLWESAKSLISDSRSFVSDKIESTVKFFSADKPSFTKNAESRSTIPANGNNTTSNSNVTTTNTVNMKIINSPDINKVKKVVKGALGNQNRNTSLVGSTAMGAGK